MAVAQSQAGACIEKAVNASQGVKCLCGADQPSEKKICMKKVESEMSSLQVFYQKRLKALLFVGLWAAKIGTMEDLPHFTTSDPHTNNDYILENTRKQFPDLGVESMHGKKRIMPSNDAVKMCKVIISMKHSESSAGEG